MNLPRNAYGLIGMRRVDKYPDDPILVSLIGKLRYSNYTLHADAGLPFDWRCIVGLEVDVHASMTVNFREVMRTLKDISACVPSRMVLSFLEGPCIECGEARGVDDFMLFDWCPVSVGPNFEKGRDLAKALFDKFGKEPDVYGKALGLVLDIKKHGVVR